MYTAFLLASVLLAALLSAVGCLCLRRIPAGARQPFALVVLGSPLFALLLGTGHLVGRLRDGCAPLGSWDGAVAAGLLTLLWGTTVLAVATHLVRTRSAARWVQACPISKAPDIAQRLRAHAQRHGIPTPTLRILEIPAPLAASAWFRTPSVVLSRGMVEALHPEELDAVLSHEVAHLSCRHPQIRWVARLLWHATFYLPGSRDALHILEADQELQADAVVAERMEGRQQLARALARVWRHHLAVRSGPAEVGTLLDPVLHPHVLGERLERLLEERPIHTRGVASTVAAGVLAVATAGGVPRLLSLGAALVPLSCRLGTL